MRFLIDENLSPRLAELLIESGHDAVHVRDLDAAGAPDTEIMSLAIRDGRIIVSADTDLDVLAGHLRSGAVVAFTRTDIRVRPLPIR